MRREGGRGGGWFLSSTWYIHPSLEHLPTNFSCYQSFVPSLPPPSLFSFSISLLPPTSSSPSPLLHLLPTCNHTGAYHEFKHSARTPTTKATTCPAAASSGIVIGCHSTFRFTSSSSSGVVLNAALRIHLRESRRTSRPHSKVWGMCVA